MRKLQEKNIPLVAPVTISQKETRWDRIRKRYTAGSDSASPPLRSEPVRRFIEMDFIDKQTKNNLLKSEEDKRKQLNPALVMDMRHEMFQQNPIKLPLATVKHQQYKQSCIEHNIAVEERFINNELNKFRQQLEKNYRRNQAKMKIIEGKDEKLHCMNQQLTELPLQTQSNDLLCLDNEQLMASLESTSEHMKDFYTVPLDAYEQVEELCINRDNEKNFVCQESLLLQLNEKNATQASTITFETTLIEGFSTEWRDEDESRRSNKCLTANISIESIDEEALLLAEAIDIELGNRQNPENSSNANPDFARRTPSPLTSTEEFLKPMREAAARHQAEVRRVRFEENLAKSKLDRENSSCSNTSDGLDSVISDLAEEALLELQMEEQQQTTESNENQSSVCALHQSEEIQKEPECIGTAEIEANKTELKQSPEPTHNDRKRVQFKDVADQLDSQSPLDLHLTGHTTPNTSSNLLIVRQLELPERHVSSSGTKNNHLDVPNNLSSSSDDDTISTHEQNLIIEQLFQSRAQTNTVILRKYFLRWVHFATFEKIQREHSSIKTDRIKMINAFLDKVRKEKVRIKSQNTTSQGQQPMCSENTEARAQVKGTAQITKKYQNKIKMQQDIIDLQRLKLERQERLIMELKLKKLSEEAKEAREEIKNELKAVIRSGDPKVKAKAKCLQLIGNLREAKDEDDFARLQGRALEMPRFLQQMQERALERSIRHEQAKQRRLQQEAEREAQRIAAEEAKRLEDEEAKRMRIEALREKRRQEKMAKIIKERDRQRAIENNRKAQEFLRRLLLRRIGMEGFKRLLQRKRNNARKSETLRRRVIKRTCFIAWRDYYQVEMSRRITKAENTHHRILKRRIFKAWIFYTEQERSNYLVAVDWYDLHLTIKTLRRWAEFTKRMKLIENTKMLKAKSHYEWNLKFKVLDCWQRLPQILQLEKETEERRQRWRMKIWELLPDYSPRGDEKLYL